MDGWEQVTLGELCEFRRGLTYKKADEVPNSRNAVLRANNITLETGEINFDEIRYIREDIEISAKKIVVPGSLLICTASGSKKHLGKAGLITDELNYAFGGFMASLLPGDRVIPKFLFWYTRSNFYQDFIANLSDGANINNLKWSQLSELSMPIPPLPEQERIVAILDEAFAAIDTATANTEKNLANAKELFQSQLEKAFTGNGVMEGWEQVKLGEVCKTSSGGTPSKLKKEYYEGGTIPWLKSGEVGKGEIRSSATFITDAGFDNSSAKLFPVNTVLVAMYGATAGEAGILRFESSTNQAVCGIYPSQSFIPEFLYRFFLYKKNELVKSATGNAQPNISQAKIRNIIIPLPPLPEQERIVAMLDEAFAARESLQSQYQQKTDSLSQLKQSLLQKAFTGELTADSKVVDRTLSEASV